MFAEAAFRMVAETGLFEWLQRERESCLNGCRESFLKSCRTYLFQCLQR